MAMLIFGLVMKKYYNTENKRCKGIKTAYQPEKDIDKDIINPIPTAELITYEAWAIGTNSGELLVAVNNLKNRQAFIITTNSTWYN